MVACLAEPLMKSLNNPLSPAAVFGWIGSRFRAKMPR
jgi:hypothetical protein